MAFNSATILPGSFAALTATEQWRIGIEANLDYAANWRLPA